MTRPNGVIQLYPLVRIALMLILGIVLADAIPFFSNPSTCVSLLLGTAAMAVLTIRHAHISSVTILVASLFLGAWLMALQKSDRQSCPINQTVTYKAIVTDTPTAHGKVLKCNLLIIDIAEKSNSHTPFLVRASILKDTLTNHWQSLTTGSTIVAQSVFNNDFTLFSSSKFNFKRWMQSHQIYATTFVYFADWQNTQLTNEEMQRIPVVEKLRLQLLQVRKRLLGNAWQQRLRADNQALIASIALGEKSNLTSAQREAYSKAGVSHVLALSGLHLGIIYSVLSTLFSTILYRIVRRDWAEFIVQTIITATLWGYVFLVGLPPGAVRSALMLTLYAFVSLLHRDRLSANSLAFACIVMLIANPSTLWDVSFQLSFLAVLSIIIFYPPLFSLYQSTTRWASLLRPVWGIVCVSMAAQVGTMPLIAYYFGRFSCYFLLSNLLILPLITLLLYATLASFIVQGAPLLHNLVLDTMQWLATTVQTLVNGISSLPHSTLDNLQFNLFQTYLAYILIASVYALSLYARKWFRIRRQIQQL